MEQLRMVLEVLKKYHFWILTGLIVLIAFGVWFLATADRASAYDAGKKRIDGEFQTVDAIAKTPNHPSQTFIDQIDKRVSGDVTTNVATAAERLMKDQTDGFKLPRIYPNDSDQAAFEADFRKVWNHRIEEIEKPPADAKPGQYEMDKTFRLRYRDQIRSYFPTLFDTIELRTPVDPNVNVPAPGRRMEGIPTPDRSGQRPGDDNSKQYKGVVEWPDAGKLQGYFDSWNDYPSTLAVMIAQEDLWVHEALLKVIRNTNDMGNDPKHEKNYQSPPDQKHARIKEIQALEIGKEALQSWAAAENQVFVVSDGGGAAAGTSGAPAQGTSGAPAQGSPGSPAQGNPGGPGPGGHVPSGPIYRTPGQFMGGISGTAGGSPLAGRYVDNAGKPLEDPAQQPNQEFRMMPIDMRLIIEQKEIPRLLTECANSNMRIDVRAVRVLAEKPPPFDPNSSGTGDATAATGTPPPTVGRSGDNTPRGPRYRGMGPPPSSPTHTGSDSGIFSYEGESADPSCPPVPVEIQGIIYIYNPPAAQTAGGETSPGAAAGGGPAAAVPPAGGAGAPATMAAPVPAPSAAPPAGARR